MNATVQRTVADFSKLKVILQFTLDELKSPRQEKAIEFGNSKTKRAQ